MLYVIGRIDLSPSERLRANRLTGKTTAIHHSEDSLVPGALKRRGEGGERELPLLAPYSSFSCTHFFQASATHTTDPLTLRRLSRRRQPPLSEQRKMSVVSPTSRFAYKSIRLHWRRFAYMIWVVSPTHLYKCKFTLWPTSCLSYDLSIDRCDLYRIVLVLTNDYTV